LVLPPRVLARSGVPESGRTLFLLAATATLAIATPNAITADGGRAAPRQPSHGITYPSVLGQRVRERAADFRAVSAGSDLCRLPLE